MSFVRIIKKNLTKILITSILTLSLGIFFGAAVQADFAEFVGDLFDTGEQGMSFTEYTGQLAELSPEGFDKAIVASSDLKQFIIKVVNFALGFLGLIAVLMMIYGGVLYVTSEGEDEKTGKGKKIIGYTAVGLLIVLGSFAFVNTVIKGATGGADEGSGTTAITSTQGFNEAAERVRSLAIQIYSGFSFLAESTEELKNIKNDINKGSLVPTALPTRNDILSFLGSVGSKLNTMKSKLQKFTVAEAKINELLRVLDTEIDTINNASGEKRYIDLDFGNDGIDDIDFINIEDTSRVCDPKKAAEADNKLANDSDEFICHESGYPYYYSPDLFNKWAIIYKKYKEDNIKNEDGIYDLINPIADDYHTDLEKRIFPELSEIYLYYGNIDAIGGPSSKAKNAYNQMIGALGYGYNYKNGTVNEEGTGLLKSVNKATWLIDTKIEEAGQKMIYGLKQQSIIFEELLKLKFVQARLTADAVEGSAPLVINFNALATVDPAGGSVQGENITWDLAGTQTTGSLTRGDNGDYDNKNEVSFSGGMFIPKDGSVDCTFTPDEGKDAEDFIGKTAKRCIYHKPGTYTAAVKINSNNPTKYAPGISALTIKVKPPTTKIELKVKGSSDQDYVTVMDYDEDGILLTDKSVVSVTHKDAKDGEGISFDASETKDVKQLKWDFGDGDTTEFSTSKTETHKYDEPGKYQVTLEVINVLGIKDKKIFTLEISSIAAKLKANPQAGSFINDTVTFDASQSKSDIGKIVNYKWTIKPSADQIIPPLIKKEVDNEYPPYEQQGGGLKTLTHTFKYPLNYDITIEVKDDKPNTATATIENYRVESQPPVAQFDYTIKDKTQPGTVYFDGGKSYDPDGTKNFKYSWTITPATDWKPVEKDGNTIESKQPIIQFKKTGDYDVTLKVTDLIREEEHNEITKTVKIENILDIAWDPKQQVTASLDDNGEAEIEFNLVSENGKAFEIDFGDGETLNGELGDDIIHKYTSADKFTVKATIYDDQDNTNTIEKKIFISGGDQPIAKIKVLVNGEEVQITENDPIPVSKKDTVTFDAVDSKNADGTDKNLKYSWNFDDKKNSTKKKATHTYKELSPKDPGYYEVVLTVSDSKDPEKNAEDEVQIEVTSLPPIFSSVQAVPQPVNNTLVTPVTALMKVFGAEDPDGSIVKYKWWYFEANSVDQQYGVQITTAPTAQLMIGTRGKQGQETTYGFGLEITDSDGLTYSNEDEISEGNFSKLTVTNGANALPTAKFNVNATSVFVGDKVTFTSSSTDPDGQIKDYIWDFDGDGFYNDEPTNEASVEHIYKEMKKAGVDVRLKVVDDKGGESISDPMKIYVDSLAQPPTAGFTFESIQGSGGMKIKFTNTATADEKAGAEILSSQWDFDTESQLPNADSNGDGKKDNDIDSQAKNPERLFTEEGAYKVKLTVTDNQGNKDEVINPVKLPLANPPLAAFTYEVKNGEIVFKNTSTADIKTGSIITKYAWDFDLNADTNGDGKKDNDNDSQVKDPTHTYPQTGKYQAKLTVIDNQGGSAEIVNEVEFTASAGTGGSGPGPAAPAGDLKAVMSTDPAPAADSYIYLSGNSGTVKFDFSKSIGAIKDYIFDKNIYFDTNGNGDKADEQDFKTSLPGTWSTNFEKAWGKIVVKLTVVDIYGNKNSTTQEIKFN